MCRDGVGTVYRHFNTPRGSYQTFKRDPRAPPHSILSCVPLVSLSLSFSLQSSFHSMPNQSKASSSLTPSPSPFSHPLSSRLLTARARRNLPLHVVRGDLPHVAE